MANFTKPAIKAAFRDLLEERPLNKITVKDVVERCGVNRNTFYYHYSDLLALLEDIVRDSLGEVVRKYPDIDSIGDCVAALMGLLADNRRTVQHIYASTNRDMYAQYLRRGTADLLHQYLNNALAGYEISDDNRLALEYCLRGFTVGLIEEWVRDGMKDDSRGVIERSGAMVNGIIGEILLRYNIVKKLP